MVSPHSASLEVEAGCLGRQLAAELHSDDFIFSHEALRIVVSAMPELV